jgi:hypothetical protein
MPSLNEFDLLLVIAQLAVAFAGFASIATALRDGTRAHAFVDAGRLTNMLIVSLCTALLSLAPTIPRLLGYPEPMVWRSSAVVALMSIVLFAPGIVRRTLRMRLHSGFNVVTNGVNMALAALAAVVFLICALNLAGTRPSATYVIGLLLMLLICSLVFFRVISSLLQQHVPE